MPVFARFTGSSSSASISEVASKSGCSDCLFFTVLRLTSLTTAQVVDKKFSSLKSVVSRVQMRHLWQWVCPAEVISRRACFLEELCSKKWDLEWRDSLFFFLTWATWATYIPFWIFSPDQSYFWLGWPLCFISPSLAKSFSFVALWANCKLSFLMIGYWTHLSQTLEAVLIELFMPLARTTAKSLLYDWFVLGVCNVWEILTSHIWLWPITDMDGESIGVEVSHVLQMPLCVSHMLTKPLI